jgi:thiol-disulfide isomerase/thioredoxin
MKRTLLFIFLLTSLSRPMLAQENPVPILNFSSFEKYLENHSDTVYILNFWATWCGPCRKELPAFEKIHLDYANEKVKVLLVSLDFPSQVEKGLQPYLKNNHITASVILLNEPDANSWIDKIDPAWTGSLPATLMYKGNNRKFFEKELSYADISSSILSFTNL